MDNELIFNSGIYPPECIEYSVRQYKDIAEIKVSSEESLIKCRFGSCVYGVPETMNEFGNFVIEVLFSKVYLNGSD